MQMDVAGALPDFMRRAADLFEALPDLRTGAAALRQIADTANQPFNLAVVGRMKTGKSTLINSLAERELAVVGVEEATATINWFCHGEGTQPNHFIVHWKDGRAESFPVERLKTDWTGKSEEVKARVEKAARLQLFSDAPRLREMQIIDTPGTGSAVEAHEAGAMGFLNPDIFEQSAAEGNKADAILYVIGAVGRESDLDNLELFRSGRSLNSGPYNSVCVIHKWDALEAADPAVEAVKKAGRLMEQLSDTVATVIPVSGPIALASRAAPDDFFERLLNVTAKAGEAEFERGLKMERRWNEDEKRAGIRGLFSGLPWASFTLIARQLRGVPAGDVSAARKRCLDYSRIAELEKFIEDHFFSQRAIIKRCQLLEKTNRVYAPSIKTIETEAERLVEDCRNAERGKVAFDSHFPELSKWMSAKAAEWKWRGEQLHTDMLSLDREWQGHCAELEGLQMDLRVSEVMSHETDVFPAEQHHQIRALCDHLATRERRSQMGSSNLISLLELQRLIDSYRTKLSLASRKHQPLIDHVLSRLEEAHQNISDGN